LRDHAEERDEQIARRAVGVVRGYFAFDQAEVAGTRACEIQDRFDCQRQHRALDKFAALGAEHRSRLGMFAKQPVVDERRQVFTTPGSEFEAALDQIFRCHDLHAR
jgi:hypothetical protein